MRPVSLLAAAMAATLATAVVRGAGAQEAPAPLPPPPYEESLLRLSEILGSLHYLRDLCGEDDGDLWRAQMQGLIDAENAPFERRVRLADAFNRGYDSYRSVHISCTPSAGLTVERFIQEGALLAAEIVARYGEDG